ncbi:MAG: SRPBCC family protein [Methylococcales bacterium]|nr:SRPBCC family protein [Methylococcales bacterium]
MKLSTLFILTLSLIPFCTHAHGPTPKKADESIVINVSIKKVWDVVKEFDQISDWHPDVKSSKGGGKNESDSVRTMTLSNDGVIEESLDYYSDKDYEYNYRLKGENASVFPVSSHTSSIQLTAEGDKTLVKWKSRFYRGDTGNTPSEKLNDESAIKAMNEFVQNGLKGLKETLE